MSTEWRALCAELLDALDGWHQAVFETGTGWVRPDEAYLVARARAALATKADGPAVPEGREPASVVGELSDEELDEPLGDLIDKWCQEGMQVKPYGTSFPLAHYVASRAYQYGLSNNHQPAPPAEGEVGELVAWLRGCADDHYGHGRRQFTRATNLLTRLALQSVPVTADKVLYEFAVYDAETDEPQAGGEAPTLEEAQREGQHYFAMYSEDGPMRLELRRVEVLPAHALPLPTSEVQP